MHRFVLLAALVSVAIASAPHLTFTSGECPNMAASQDFDTSMITGKRFFISSHTDKTLHDAGCCTCAYVDYEMKDGYLFSHRKGSNTNGETVNTYSRFVPMEGAPGKYMYYMRQGDDFVNTGLLLTFYYKDGYLGTYGCIKKDDTHGEVAIISSTMEQPDTTKLEEMKTHFTDGGFTGTYLDVSHENCKY